MYIPHRGPKPKLVNKNFRLSLFTIVEVSNIVRSNAFKHIVFGL